MTAAAQNRLNNAGVAAVAVGILRGNFIEHLLGNILAGEEGQRLTVGGHVLLLAKGDHFLGERRDLFCAEDGRLHAAHVEQIRDLLNLKGHRVAGGMRASLYNAMPNSSVPKLMYG